MKRARADGRGVVFALPHSGNWDAAGVWLVDFLGGPFMTVVERLRPESLYRRFLAYRGTAGMRVVPPPRGPRPSSGGARGGAGGGGRGRLPGGPGPGAGGGPGGPVGRGGAP